MLLSKQTRKKFLEQDWSKMKKDDDNLSQTIRRLEKEVNTGLSDLSLLSRRLPDEEQARVFNTSKLEDLLKSLMIFEKNAQSTPRRRPKNFKIAMLLIKYGLYELKEIYDKLYRNTPYMTEHVSEKLQDTIHMCEDLTLGVIRSEIEREAIKEKLVYLFSIDNISIYEHNQFENFVLSSIPKKELEKAASYPTYVVVNSVLVENFVTENISRHVTEIIDNLEVGQIGTATIFLDKEKLIGRLEIELYDITRISRELIVKKKDDDFLFYIPLK